MPTNLCTNVYDVYDVYII